MFVERQIYFILLG